MGTSDGGFTIPGAPESAVFLSLSASQEWLETDGGVGPFDLSAYYLGRSNVVKPATGTMLTLSSNKMRAWQEGDDIEVVSPGAGLSFGDLVEYEFPTPAAGKTTLDAGIVYTELIEPNSTQGGLIDSSKGDVLYVTHLVNQPVTAALYSESSVQESFVANNLKMTQGAFNRTSGQFTDGGTAGSISLTFPSSEFAAIRAGANANATDAYDLVYVDALPQGTTAGGFLGGPDLVVAYVNPSTSDVPLTFKWVDPFPASWPLMVSASEGISVVYTQPGGTATQTLSGTIAVQVDYDGSTRPSLLPGVGAVTHPMINQSALDSVSQSNVGLTPTLSWTAPTGAAPTYYEVILEQMFEQNLPFQAATFTLPGTQTSMQFPPGVLNSNGSYVAIITANYGANQSLSQPFVYTLPLSTVPVLSAIFQPAQGVVLGGVGSTGWPEVPNQGDVPTIASPNLVLITYTDDSNKSVVESFGTWIMTQGYLPAVAGEYGVGSGSVQSIELESSTWPTPVGTSTNYEAFPDYFQELFAAGQIPPFASNNIYALIIPSSWGDTNTFCMTEGGYHTTYLDNLGNPVVYAIIPNCATGETVATQQQQIEVALSHEIVEASTDPLIGTNQGTYQIEDMNNPWFYLGGEVGDLCSSNDIFYTSGSFSAQLIWSNKAVAAGKVPCQPWTDTTNYYSLVGPSSTATGAAGSTVDITVTGWSSLASTKQMNLYVTDGDYDVDFYTTPKVSSPSVAPGDTVKVTLTIPATATSGQHGAAYVLAEDPDTGNYDGSTMVSVTVQ